MRTTAWMNRPKRLMPEEQLKYLCDSQRHLICRPYSEKSLHQMAADLDIGRHWFHKDHYDIPKSRVAEIKKKCEVVTVFDIIEIIPHRYSG